MGRGRARQCEARPGRARRGKAGRCGARPKHKGELLSPPAADDEMAPLKGQEFRTEYKSDQLIVGFFVILAKLKKYKINIAYLKNR